MGNFSDLIIGATGPLGIELSEALENPVGVSRKSNSETFEGELVHADITENIPFNLGNFDTVYHLATLNNNTEAPKNSWPEIEGTKNILEEVKSLDKDPRIVYVSTGAVVDSDIENLDQFNQDRDLNYPEANSVGEILAKNYQNSCMVRPGNIYGSGNGVISNFLEKAENGETIEVYGNGEQQRPFIHIEDVVDALLEADETGSLEAYEDHYSIKEIAGKVTGLYDVEVKYNGDQEVSSRKMPDDFRTYDTEISLGSWLNSQRRSD